MNKWSNIPNYERQFEPVLGFEKRIVVTSTFDDRHNTNASIRSYLTEALRKLVPPHAVQSCPHELIDLRLRSLDPDIIIAVGSIASDAANLRGLRRAADAADAVLIYWLHDDPYEFDYALKAEITADIIFSNDEWAVEYYQHESVHHLPLAASPDHHFRPLRPYDRRDYDVFFCGVAYPNRVEFLRRADDILARRPCAILGAGWPSWLRCARNLRLSPAEMADHAQASRLTLNLGRTLDIANRRRRLPSSTPGPRTFEAAMAGTTQLYLVESLAIADYFVPSTEIVLIDEVSDLAEQLTRLQDEAGRFEEIAAAAQRRALAEHTYEHRARRILDVAVPGLSARSGASS